MILTCAKLGYAGVALTDHEALCGHVEWLELEEDLKKKKLIPEDFKCALGNEIYLTDTREEKQKYFHFLLIAKNTEGHRALRELSSNSWLKSYRYRGMERVPTLKDELKEIVHKYPNSLIADSACLGSEIDSLILSLVQAEKDNNTKLIWEIKTKIDSFMKFCIELFGDDFYIEIAPGISKDQKTFNKRVKPIAKYYKRKIVIGCDAHYLLAKDREIHKAFLNSKEGEREVDSFYHDAHFMSDEEAYERLSDIFSKEEFDEMCQNSLEIMNKIKQYNIFHKPIIPEVEVPHSFPYFDESLNDYPNLQKLRNSNNPQEREWIIKCLGALKQKDLDDKIHMNRLELEADVISTISEKLGNCLYAYFNTFCHYIDLFWECGSVIGPGRGSSGSFLSNFLLGITQLDPVKWNLPYFRFLNKERAELPDIDCDLAPSKRPLILKKIREERGELNVAQVATFGTESSRAALACAARGYRSEDYPKGIDVDIAQYMSSLVPSERGITRSLTDCIYGNEEKGLKPIRELVFQLDQYPGLKEIALGVEGLICRRGQHASGVMMYNNSPFDTTALMRSPNGDITTQFDLHRSEKLGDTKFDFLVTEVCDKLSVCLSLLMKDNYFPDCKNIREVYNKVLHPDAINLKDNKIWEALKNGSVQDVFQFNTEIGIQTAKAISPTNPAEMTSANALMRLVAPEGEERPFDRYIRFKENISLWYKEMDNFGLTKEEQKILEPYYKRDYGVPASQEQLMLLVMDKNISHFTLAESNATRKVLAKKKIKEIPVVKEKFLSQCSSNKLGEYCWKTMMLPQLSYSFSEVHSLLYSFIGIQTIILATNFPSIYWNCACLIVNSQSIDERNEEELENEEEVEENEEEEEENEETKVKKKAKVADYGRIASAIGKMAKQGIVVYPPSINDSGYTFEPDKNNNLIRFGLKAIVKISEELTNNIISNRPYSSLQDFLSKVKVNKPQMINLIKSGAFDSFGNREQMMREYINLISDTKKRITLQNMKMLIDFNLIPNDYDLEKRVFNFDKYLKKFKFEKSYLLDNIAMNFFERNFCIDSLDIEPAAESGYSILQTKWKKIYDSYMNKVRPFVKENNQELLEKVNKQLTKDVWEKYCLGSISKWEMDSVSCYFHEHELTNINYEKYGFSNFFDLAPEPEISNILMIKGKKIPIYKIRRICGTVLDKNKMKKTVTLLMREGVVEVKIFGEVFSIYDRQISERGADGKKHVIQKSFFTRGNKIIVTGIRREDSFQAKKYKSTPYHLVELIDEINDDGTITVKERIDV